MVYHLLRTSDYHTMAPRQSEPAIRLGIDLGGTKIEIIGARRRALRASSPPHTHSARGLRGDTARHSRLVHQAERQLGDRCTIGIGTPGALSRKTGALKNSNSTCLNGMPLLDDLTRLLKRPVRIANDANCFALSEAVDGAARGASVVFGVIVGTGVVAAS